MHSGFARYRLLITLTSGFCFLPLPVLADSLKEASPVSQPQSAPQNQQPAAKSAPLQVPSTPPSDEDSYGEEPNDPLEPLNRLIFGINDLLDFIILRPIAEIYRAVTPEPVRNGVTNVLDNLFAPVSFLNHALQGEGERATVTLFRFLMNSSFGLFGLVDVTSDLGYPRYDTDFNQTLSTWGVDTGPYLVLPLIGPSSFRGGVGFVGDYYADPLNLYLNNRHHRKHRYWLTVRYGFDIISHREKVLETIDNLRNGSPDFYVTMRSTYFQRQTYMDEKRKAPNTPAVAPKEEK
jgi:phospholipid-binding lipoprotein MlaA